MAQHEGTVGDYALVMPMSTEQSVIGGETFGEPKKIADVTLDRDGDRVSGRSLASATFAEVNGRATETLPTRPTGDARLLLQVPAGTRRQGFDAEPSLVYCYRDETTRALERGTVSPCASPASTRRRHPRARSADHARRAQSIQTAEIHSHVPGDWLSCSCTSAMTTCRRSARVASDIRLQQGRGRHRWWRRPGAMGALR
jgi:hypothetical protein